MAGQGGSSSVLTWVSPAGSVIVVVTGRIERLTKGVKTGSAEEPDGIISL
jgi:hypothetical protein